MRRAKGTGTVVKKGSDYYARWRRRNIDVYGAARSTRDEAETDRLLGPPEGTALAGKPLKAAIPTLQAWAQMCMEGRYGKRLALATFDTNEVIRAAHLEGTKLGKMRLDWITRTDAQDYIDEKETQTYFKGGKEQRFSPRYIRRIHAFLAKVVALAQIEGYVASNPFQKLELPEVEERINRVLAPTEARLLLNPQNRTDAIMLVALHTGMRRGELARLQWNDVNETTIRVPGTKSAKSRAVVPTTPEAWQAINAQPKRSVFVFSTEGGKPLSLRNLNRDVARRKLELGLPAEMRLHDLRGTYGSILIESGADIRTVAELMRHSDPRTTMKSYLRSRPETRHAAVESLRRSISGEKPKKKPAKKA